MDPRGQEGDWQRAGVSDGGRCTHSYVVTRTELLVSCSSSVLCSLPSFPCFFAFENEICTTVPSCDPCYSGTMVPCLLFPLLVGCGWLVRDQPSPNPGGDEVLSAMVLMRGVFLAP